MFIPRKSAKHRVPKKFSTKNPTQKDRTAGKKKGSASSSKMAPKKHKKTTSSQYDMLEDDHLSNDMQTLFNEDNESFTPDASHSADDSGDEGDEGDDEEDERTRRAATTIESNPVEREKRRLLPKRKTLRKNTTI